MSAMLYQINIMDVSPAERRVRILVTVAYFDGYMNIRLPAASALGFFLQVLADPSGSSAGKTPFYTEQLGLEQLNDFKWVLKNAYHHIERVERLWIQNDDRASYTRCFDAINRGEDIPSDAYIEAEYVVTVTDPAGLSHLSPRTGWGTTVWNSGDRSVVLKVDEAHRAVLPDLSSPLHTIDFEYEGAFHPIHFSQDGTRMMVGTYPSRNVLTFDTSDWKLVHTNKVTEHSCYLAFDRHLGRYWAKRGKNRSHECWTFDGQRIENVELPSFGVYATELCEDNDDEDWDGIIEFKGSPENPSWFHPSPSGSYYCMLEEYGPPRDAGQEYIVLYNSPCGTETSTSAMHHGSHGLRTSRGSHIAAMTKRYMERTM